MIYPLLLIALASGVAATAARAVEIEKIPGQERFTFEAPQITDLSGLVWNGGASFFAVCDQHNWILPLALEIDSADGRIAKCQPGEILHVPSKFSDFEGITYVAAEKAFYISCERGNGIVRFKPGDAAAQPKWIPSIYARARANLSLESLTWNDTARCFWTSNEEALEPDGPVTSATAGSLVRLQQFDARFRPVAQYAWRTETAGFRFHDVGSGVSDLCELPDGRLIVLERGFGAGGLQLRLFLADFTGATNTSKIPALADAKIAPAKKTLLFSEATGFTNFEGIALGPVLADGSRSLIVIADSNGGGTHVLLPLRLRLGKVITRAGAAR